MNESKRIVISGGPGAGKTALLEELHRRGYACSPEVARQVIQQQVLAGGDALPWSNREQYARLMLAGSIAAWKEDATSGQTVFFDRGVPDTLCYVHLAGLSKELERDVQRACSQYRYWTCAFLAPPWREIYETDAERKQDFEEAVRTYELMEKTYRDCDYEAIPIPMTSVSGRADFVLEEIATWESNLRA